MENVTNKLDFLKYSFKKDRFREINILYGDYFKKILLNKDFLKTILLFDTFEKIIVTKAVMIQKYIDKGYVEKKEVAMKLFSVIDSLFKYIELYNMKYNDDDKTIILAKRYFVIIYFYELIFRKNPYIKMFFLNNCFREIFSDKFFFNKMVVMKKKYLKTVMNIKKMYNDDVYYQCAISKNNELLNKYILEKNVEKVFNDIFSVYMTQDDKNDIKYEISLFKVLVGK